MGGDAQTPHLKPHHPENSFYPVDSGSGGASVDHFPLGSVVEVRTDEEDFQGVYFTATVISPPASSNSPKKSCREKPRGLYVEYHNLLAHEDGSDRLKELVDPSYVRPEPPLQEIVKGFEPDDVVDAFYRDGWWLGVVSRVVEGGGRFVVTFQNPPDVLEFGLGELRFHWDWVNGSWVRPQKQSIAGLMFDMGRKVEVSFDREDSQDAWFPATIHDDLGNGVFRVEYMDNKGEARKTTVDSLHVRPCPPLLKDKNFVLLEKVDAFFDFCWWSGVITKELENCRYIVFFKQMKQDKIINQTDLRPHMEWKDGKWFTSSQEAPIQSSDDGGREYHTSENSSASATTAPVKDFVDGKDTCDAKTPNSLALTKGYFKKLTPENQKKPRVTTPLTKKRQYLSDSGTTLSQPVKKHKEGSVVEAKHQDDDGPIKEVVCGFVSPDSVSNIVTSATQITKDQPSCNHSWDKKIQRKQRNVRSMKNASGKIKTTPSSMKKNNTKMLFNSRLDVTGEVQDAAGNPEEDAQNEHAKEGTELPIIIGLPCIDTGSPGFGISRGRRGHHFKIKEVGTIVNDQAQQLIISSIQKIKDNTQSGTGKSSEKRKRGRPKRILVESTQTPLSGDLRRKEDNLQISPRMEVIATEAMMPDQEKIEVNKKKVADDQSDPKYRKVRMLQRKSPSVHLVKGVKESVKLGENHLLKKRGRKKASIQVQDSLGASGGTMMEVDRTVEVERVVEVPSTEFDNEPLSKWIVEMNSPSLIDSLRLSPEGVSEQCRANGEKQRDGGVINEGSGTQLESGKEPSASIDKEYTVSQTLPVVLDKNSEKRPESGTQASVFVEKGSIVLCDAQILPFVKNTSLWNTIESMEVFQKIPQKPHFQPLEQVKESSYREGLAIGFMVTFASLVERTSKLQVNDPKSIIDDMMGTVAELDKHGFDVRVLQDRVSEFLEVKNKEEKLVDEVNNLNNQLLERNHVKTRIDEEIQEISEQIRELQEKRAVAESVKEKEVDEVASLQVRLKETEERIENLRRNFKGAVSENLR